MLKISRSHLGYKSGSVFKPNSNWDSVKPATQSNKQKTNKQHNDECENPEFLMFALTVGFIHEAETVYHELTRSWC